MKTTLTIVVLLIFQSLIYAQDESNSNSFVLGGSFNFNLQENPRPFVFLNLASNVSGFYSNLINDSKNVNFTVAPYIGKELNNKWMLGLEIEYTTSYYRAIDEPSLSTPSPITYKRNTNQIGAGIFSRYTFNPNNKFHIYIQPYARYSYINEEQIQNSTTEQELISNYVELGSTIGGLYNINDKWRITFNAGGLSYLNGNWEILDSNTNNNFSLFSSSLSLSSIRFGIEMKF